MPAPLSFLDAPKTQAEGSAVSTAAPLTFGKALAQSVEKGQFRHANGKFRVGTPVALADLEDIGRINNARSKIPTLVVRE